MTLKEAVLAYDAALSACANDPEKMSSFCTAEGQDLDDLYAAVLEAACRDSGDDANEAYRLSRQLLALHGKTANTHGDDTLWDAATALRRLASAQAPQPKGSAPLRLTDEQVETAVKAAEPWLRHLDEMRKTDRQANIAEAIHAALSASQLSVQASDLPSWWNEFIQNVCEIPGRNSPENEPEAMVATAQELENCALRAIESVGPSDRAAVDEPVAADGDCGNAECGWRGPLSECSYLGAVGPCCPRCREIVEPDALTTQEPAEQRIDNWPQLQNYSLAIRALRALLAEPYGCPFCHSGKIINPAKSHDDDCGFELARRALTAPTPVEPGNPANQAEPFEHASIVEQSMAALIDSLLPAFSQVGVSLRVSVDDHNAIRSALAGAQIGLHLLRRSIGHPAGAQGGEGSADDALKAFAEFVDKELDGRAPIWLWLARFKTASRSADSDHAKGD